MLNLLTKTKPWMVASLIVASSVFGQNNTPCNPKQCPPKASPKPCPQPCPPTQVCAQDPCCPTWPIPVLNAAYNYPARMQTRCPWDFNFDASFIYWQASQDNMELGFSADTLTPTFHGNMVNMQFDFKPGFKVGLGGNFAHDNWDMYLEYTWFHNTDKQTARPVTGGALYSSWGNPYNVSQNECTSINETWNLKMDIIDLDLGRWYYVGTNLLFRPNFGARANWIRQKTNVHVATTSGNAVADNIGIYNKSTSWALGPKFGLDTNWNIGYGIRMFGNGFADLLFTDYTRLRYSETHTDVAVTPFVLKQSKIYVVRPHMDMELGFGWGTYLDCNNWYIDFAAGYEFQVFFDQNMNRHFNDDTSVANSMMPNGNLYVQGLTATFKLDF